MLHTEEIYYNVEDTRFRGYIAYRKGHEQPKPCILIAHDWSGCNEFVRQKAEKLANMGYVGFAVDMYGDGKTGNTKEEKKALLTPLMENRSQILARMQAAFNEAASLSRIVNPNQIAAMGYCFGGLCVLDLARGGADIKGGVSFHGLLVAPEQTVCEKIKAKILVLHGYDDPLVPPEQVKQFASEMKTKNADWQVHMYGQTQHSFTNPQANDIEMGLHYNALANHRSWITATEFFNELFNNHRKEA